MDEFIVYKDGLKTKFYKCDKKVQKVYNKYTWKYYCLRKNKWIEEGMCLSCKYKKEVQKVIFE